MEKEHKSGFSDKEAKVLIKEFKENPFEKFSNAFALMAIIPFLVFFYLLTTWLSSIEVLTGRVGFILLISICISLCGFFIGRKILKEIVFYSARAIRKDRSKSEMVAAVSHDLKNPLTALLANIDGMLDGFYGPMGKEQTDILKFCQQIVIRMCELVKNMLDLYKVEAGKTEIKRKLCNIQDIIEKQTKEFENLINSKRIKLVKEDRSRELSVWGDENRISQVVNNLLSNAIKYTPEEGKVAVKVIPSGESVRLEFEDGGESIPSDKQEKIFDKFERLDPGKEGTGLGLAIARDIVELHKGKIWVESQPDKGNKFIVVLPRDLRKTER